MGNNNSIEIKKLKRDIDSLTASLRSNPVARRTEELNLNLMSTIKDVEELKKNTAREIEELKRNTAREIEELKKNTTREIEELKKNTTREIEELKKNQKSTTEETDKLKAKQATFARKFRTLNERMARTELHVGLPRQEEEPGLDCVVCEENPAEVALVPCGHYSCCQGCAENLETCPLCRAEITSRQRIYC